MIIENKILEKEEQFHNRWAKSVDIKDIMVNEFFEACTAPENRFIISQMNDISGKYLLELGCGLGEAAVYFAKKGAKVLATDISREMLGVTLKLAEQYNVKVETKHGSYSEAILDFSDETFDIVYAANFLHHVDISNVVDEVFRVLKKGGKFYSWDPLAYNPIINIYRKKAMGVRTEDEHPLTMEDVQLFKKKFALVKCHYTWFFTLWIFIKFYFFDGIDPNRERYWKKILVDYKKLEKTYMKLEKLDHFILSILPFLKRYCWNIVIIAEK